MERTPQDIALQAQSYLYEAAEQLDQVADALAGANNNLSTQLRQLGEQGHAIGLQFDQLIASFSGQTLTAQLQSICLCLTLVQDEFASADRVVRNRRARLQEGAQVPATTAEEERRRRQLMEINNARYQEAMAYHRHTGAAAQVLETLRDKLDERLWLQNNPEPPDGECSVCGCTEEDCSDCIDATGEPCSWANAERTLCTRCVETSLDTAAVLGPEPE